MTRIVAGQEHTCALTNVGAVLCWGRNDSGQLGDNSTINRRTPVAVAGLASGVGAIAAGLTHTCALTTAGGVVCWGDNRNGQLGDGSKTNRSRPVQVSGLASGIQRIDAGASHTCALTTSGTIKCWGNNFFGQLGNNSTDLHSTPVDVAGVAGDVAAVSTGNNHTCALTTAGQVLCWGYNGQGSIGDGSTTTRLLPTQVSGLTSGVKFLSAGNEYSCAVTSTGGVKCWGWNVSGQLGDNSTIDRLVPVDVIGLSSGVDSVATGAHHACALTESGAAKCWGSNFAGQVGDGTTIDRLSPASVVGMSSGTRAVEGGSSHTCAVTASGGAKCWGENLLGQLGDDSHTTRLTPVDVVVVANPNTEKPPGAPTGVGVTQSAFGYGQVTVRFAPPLSDGGSPISSYTVTSSPGGFTMTGPASPIFVSGLTNGTSYAFTVTATNEVGTGPPSTPSTPITVTAFTNIPPIANPGFSSLRILLVPFHFPEVEPPFPISHFEEELNGDDAYSARSLWLRNSYGAFTMSVDVKPWMPLRKSKSDHQRADPSGKTVEEEALEIVAENYALDGYDAVAIIPTPIDYGFPGAYAYLPPGRFIGRSSRQMPVVVVTRDDPASRAGLTAHEIGHTIGFLHTSTISCSGTMGWTHSVPPALSDPYFDEGGCGPTGKATLYAYAHGDPMGAYSGQTHALNMFRAGWLRADQIVSMTADGSIYLDALDGPSSGVKAVTLPLGRDPNGATALYTIDYRGYEILSPDARRIDATSGLITDRVTLWLDLPGFADLGLSERSSEHLNFSADDPQLEMALAAGQVFWDRYRGIRVQRGSDRTLEAIKQTQVTIERSKLTASPEYHARLIPGERKEIMLRNDGSAEVVVSSTALKGRDAALFEIVQDGCSSTALATNASCRIVVHYKGGTASARAYVQWNNSDRLRPEATLGLVGVPGEPAKPRRRAVRK